MSDVPSQDLGALDVRIAVKHVGLCGTDLNTFRGLNPLVELPRIPGHEAVGTIIETGSEVGTGVEVGMSGVLWPYSACGECTSCRAGRSYACRYNKTLGVQRDGALRENIVLPASCLIANNSIPLERLVLVEPLSVGFHAARRGMTCEADTVVVFGCGMIGLGAIMGAERAGAKVIAVDPIAAKKDIALTCGADSFTSATGDDLLQEIDAATNGNGADLVIEAVGLPATFTAAVDIVAFSGRIVYVGYSKAPVTYDTKYFNLKELNIYGSRNASREDFDTVISALEHMGDKADQLISRYIPFAEAETALPYWNENPQDVLKLVVTL